MAIAELQIHVDQVPRLGTFAGLRIREDVLFTNHKGNESRGVEGRAKDALEHLQEPLRRLLAPDEVILCTARAQAPVSMFEQLTLGWAMYRLTTVTLVLTNRRLFHFAVDSTGTWRRRVKVISWGDPVEIKAAAGLLNSILRLRYRDGTKEQYWKLRRGDSKKIKAVLSAVLPSSTGIVSATGTMTSLCPECFAALTPRVYHCPQCGLVFKDERTLIRRSILIPGGGYFYIGYVPLGILDFVAEAVLLLQAILAAIVVVAGLSGVDQDAAQSLRETIVALVFFVGLLLLEKAGTIHHCRRFVREFIPTNNRTAPMPAAVGQGAIGPR